MSERNKRNQGETDGITHALAAPFQLDEIKFKPQVVKGNRALALAYIDARVIQDRLDEVLGVDGWQDEYTRLDDGSVICKLRLRIGDEWITKMDVGSPSARQEGSEGTKGAFSDALKRAAVKFGIGRYLYRVPQIWCDYDPVKKQFSRTPTLPAFAVPGRQAAAPPRLSHPPEAPKPASKATMPATKSPAKGTLPASGGELLQRLREYDDKLARDGTCQKGALVQHVAQEGVKAGHSADLTSWTGPAIEFAVEATRSFEALQLGRKLTHKAVA